MLIQQHGKPVYFESLRHARPRRQSADDKGYDLSALFDVEAGHFGCGHDAGRGRQDRASRSALEIHSGFCRREGRRREADETASSRLRSNRSSGRSRSRICCATPRASPTASTATARCASSTRMRICSRAIRQCRVRRASRQTAARRAAGNAVGLRPFDRRARPRRRGGFREIAVSVREGTAARSARDERDRLFCSRGAARRVSPNPCRAIASTVRSRASTIPTRPRRWESGGAGMDRHGRRLCALCADAAGRRRTRRQALSQTGDGQR